MNPLISSTEAGVTLPHTAEALYTQLLEALALRQQTEGPKAFHLVGIRTGGLWLAQRLQRDLGLDDAPGEISTSFHRDDYHERGIKPRGGSTTLPFTVDGAEILLVDDVLHTGRTIRAALNEIFDYGRPARVTLAVLVDRGGRQLPIAADICPLTMPIDPSLSLRLSRDETHGRFEFNLTHR